MRVKSELLRRIYNEKKHAFVASKGTYTYACICFSHEKVSLPTLPRLSGYTLMFDLTCTHTQSQDSSFKIC